MMQLFGTDGVRARINSGAMTAENILRLALASGKYFLDKGKRSSGRPMVVVGKDTRRSGYMVESALQAGFASIGMDAMLLGPLPTPAVAYMTRVLEADIGVMISASHNPHEDNGIKLFGPDGYKLPDEVEAEIASIMSGHIALAEPSDLGRAHRRLDGVERYIEHAKSVISKDMRFDGLKVVLDCGNGAGYKAAPEILSELGAEIIPLGVEPDGFNINKDCGAVHPQAMTKAVTANKADLGIALDGDADRVILSDEKGGLIDGDQCLAAIGDDMAQRGELKGKGIIGTLMTNHGFSRWCEERGITLERVQVGDRYVLARMREGGFNLGGEPSGHILMSDYATTGDGIMAALKMLALLKKADQPASTALRRFEPYPQEIVNIKIKTDAADIIKDKRVGEAIASAEASLGNEGRVVVRPSGTEPLIRVMVEAVDKAALKGATEKIASAVQACIEA